MKFYTLSWIALRNELVEVWQVLRRTNFYELFNFLKFDVVCLVEVFKMGHEALKIVWDVSDGRTDEQSVESMDN